MTKFSKWKVPLPGVKRGRRSLLDGLTALGRSRLFIARPSGGLVLEYDCTVPAQTPSLMGLTTCVGPMALPVVARPAVIHPARLRESGPRRGGWSLSRS